MRPRLTSVCCFCTASAIACGTGWLWTQTPDTPPATSVGPRAVEVVLKHFAANPLASDPNTHQPLRADGSWSLSKSRPASCPQATEMCVEVFYAVPGQSAKCSWIVSLDENDADGNILDENEDADTYMVRIVADNEATSFVKSRNKPVYPPIAIVARVTGPVVTRVLVGKSGEVQRVIPVSGPPMLIGTSVEAVKKWSFLPMTIGTQTVQYEVQVVFTFSLPIPSAPSMTDVKMTS